MPEGHSVHRIARQFTRNFAGKQITASSPQGRFAEGAAVLNGCVLEKAQAVGKQMFLEFEGDLWLRVHLGLYGAWDFAGEVLVDATIVRCILVPASMRLLGKWNWYLPSFLGWLPEMRLERSAAPEAVAVGD